MHQSLTSLAPQTKDKSTGLVEKKNMKHRSTLFGVQMAKYYTYLEKGDFCINYTAVSYQTVPENLSVPLASGGPASLGASKAWY